MTGVDLQDQDLYPSLLERKKKKKDGKMIKKMFKRLLIATVLKFHDYLQSKLMRKTKSIWFNMVAVLKESARVTLDRQCTVSRLVERHFPKSISPNGRSQGQ
jgi:hypothetical protein